MRVLIVEDNAFNAFCLRRLLESLTASVTVSIANNSQTALVLIANHCPDLLVVDGDLGAGMDIVNINGPEIASVVLEKYPELPIIAWTDSDSMRESFAAVFAQHGMFLNEYNSWTKVISLERIGKTWTYYFDEFMASQNAGFINHPVVSAR